MQEEVVDAQLLIVNADNPQAIHLVQLAELPGRVLLIAASVLVGIALGLGPARLWTVDSTPAGISDPVLRFADGQEVESVHIPEEDRGTLCVSSQVGCTLTCTFCHTGTQKLVRNLTAGEIVGQVLALMHELGPKLGEHTDEILAGRLVLEPALA